MPEKQSEGQNVQTRILYTLATYQALISTLFDMGIVGEDVYLCHRADYHEDGSISHYYYLKLEKADFLAMGGLELAPRDKERT